jgi:hypothetical protein
VGGAAGTAGEAAGSSSRQSFSTGIDSFSTPRQKIRRLYTRTTAAEGTVRTSRRTAPGALHTAAVVCRNWGG